MELGIPPLEQVKFEFVRYTRGSGLDVGRGPVKAFPHFAAVRLADDEECEAAKKREIVVADLLVLDEVEDGKCDFVLAADVLHAAAEPGAAVFNWLSKIRVDGHLCIFEPDAEKFGKTDFVKAVEAASQPVDVVRFEAWPAGGIFTVLRKRGDDGDARALITSFSAPAQEKSALVIRHGGFGDQLQAAFLFPELKRQGYHITVLTTPTGRAIIEHDPHVDEWFMVDRNQVPNGELAWFWSVVGRRYDKVVNLNESVEGTFLAIPGRVQHMWPQELRHKYMNGNYAEHAAAIAEIPFKPEGRFYATDEEKTVAQTYLAKVTKEMNPGFVIGERGQPVFNVMWVLAGSSPHKFTPHQDVVIRAILDRLKRASITLVGGVECKILEAGWETEPRVYCRSGEMSIRDTLALAQEMDLIVGPETGVMNSVAYNDKVRKVVMLSHSSHENLTKHWVNTAAVEGRAHCYPCHRLHITAEFCPREPKSGAALCQAGVFPEDLYGPIDSEYTGWARVQLLRSA